MTYRCMYKVSGECKSYPTCGRWFASDWRYGHTYEGWIKRVPTCYSRTGGLIKRHLAEET